MKRLLLVILVVLAQATAAGAQSVQGHVADAATGQAVPFVNIGVVGKDLGTVANEKGAYQLPFREALATDTVRVSSIGYRARLLTLRALQALPNVALKLSCTYPADEAFEGEEEAGEAFTIGLEADKDAGEDEEYEPGTPHNIFYLEGVFLRVEP